MAAHAPNTENPVAPDATPARQWVPDPEADDDLDSALGEDIEGSTASISSSILHYRTVNGRTYHSDRGTNQYQGANDDKQNNTLDIAHYCYTLALDHKLYLAPLPEHIDKAIDIGTGTGLWAIDFADERPKTDVVGTDLSPIQPTWVPPNLTFQIDDFSQPWTFEPDSIDYVHARFLVGSVEDWTELFKSAYRVLKPGGWLESYDFDYKVQSDDGTLTKNTALSQVFHIFQDGARKLGSRARFDIIEQQLQRKAFENAGFANIKEKSVKIPFSEWSDDPKLHDVGLFGRAALHNDIEGMIGYMATQIGWSQEEISVYAAHFRRELRGLKVHGYDRGLVVYGQKLMKP